jgi:arylsulfatase A-like enzyme
VPGLANGTTAGTTCSKPVNLLSLFPTLTELAGLPPKSDNDGPTLVPLLKDSNADWKHTSVTYLGDAGSYGLSTENWRYIHYSNGDEELYDSAADRYEWTNLAAQPEHLAKLKELRAIAPLEPRSRDASRIDNDNDQQTFALTQERLRNSVPILAKHKNFFVIPAQAGTQ